MTGHQFRALRLALGMSWTEYGRALGYNGTHRNVIRQVTRYEALHEELVPPGAATRALALSTARGIDWRVPNHP